jgi:formylglycine-generating enzyme
MRKLCAIISLLVLLVVASACMQKKAEDHVSSKGKVPENSLVLVKGGTFVNENSSYNGQTLSDFYISKYEITQKEWMEVMGSNPSAFKGDHLPVEMVSWYDAIEYCNRRSIKEGLEPYYHIDKTKKDPNNLSEHDRIKWTVTINEGANGYRLPTEAEWEYAASGGQLSRGYTYSGSNHADEVAWYWRNAGDKYLSGEWNWPLIQNNNNKTKPVGSKKPNELGLYDMSGNVREWCWDWYGETGSSDSGSYRVVKGGGWMGDVRNTEISFRGKFEASGIGPDQGFRVVRGV